MRFVNFTIQNARERTFLAQIRNRQSYLLVLWINQWEFFSWQSIVLIRLFQTNFFARRPRLASILLHKYFLWRFPKSLLVRSSWHQVGGFFNIEVNARSVSWALFNSWDRESKWNQDVENFIWCGAFDVPDPENNFTCPLLLEEDEDSLEADVNDAGDTPEENPGHRLLEGEHISSVDPDTVHPSKRAMIAHEPAFLNRKWFKVKVDSVWRQYLDIKMPYEEQEQHSENQ